jgi:hypothetical protein
MLATVIGAASVFIAVVAPPKVTLSVAVIGVSPELEPLLSNLVTVTPFAIVKSTAFTSFIFVKIGAKTNALVKIQASLLDKNLFLVSNI